MKDRGRFGNCLLGPGERDADGIWAGAQRTKVGKSFSIWHHIQIWMSAECLWLASSLNPSIFFLNKNSHWGSPFISESPGSDGLCLPGSGFTILVCVQGCGGGQA